MNDTAFRYTFKVVANENITAFEQLSSINKDKTSIRRYLLKNIHNDKFFIFQPYHRDLGPDFTLKINHLINVVKSYEYELNASGWLWGPINNERGWHIAGRAGNSHIINIYELTAIQTFHARRHYLKNVKRK